ncbi:rhomboid family intramembrane serine protease [Streptomyces sp. A7024]|uniref:Rhomboid family intramembrane serine protease n=1 Tax=Streptomyces coryli TaxID=1128680 RepID=A0A6G4U993_9ACTN|nr:rhomboid family intramembrane serine protease [Streptomyces coryli]NGN68799.1 rhomboid family intramembrane serine protease [Streptomyces coryli]
MEATPNEQAASTPTTCYRHPDRETHVRCTRCDRYICPDCMREAAVGFQCPECVNEGNREVRQARTAFGGTLRQNFVPVVTYTLIALNVLAYIAQATLGDEFTNRFDNLGRGLMAPNGDLYNDTGMPIPGLEQVGVAYGEWWRLLTSAFLHQPPTSGIGPLHLLMNMYMLWMLGRVVEQGLGRSRYLALYLISAIGGSVLGYVISPDQPALGASGAIFGLIGAYYLMTRRLGRPDTQFLITGLLWLVISAGFTSWEGHLGGLLAGGATAFVFAYTPQHHRKILHIAGPAVVLVVLIATTLIKTSTL